MYTCVPFSHVHQEGMNILHCAAINNHTDIVKYIVNDLQMKTLDKEDQVRRRLFDYLIWDNL